MQNMTVIVVNAFVFWFPSSVHCCDVSISQLAQQGARCDYGIFAGASSSNYSSLPLMSNKVIALKMYLNDTFTTLKLDDITIWMKV